jgi:hypothetical protein
MQQSGGGGEAAALVLATQEFVANGGRRPSCRRRRSAASPGRTGSRGRVGRRGCWRSAPGVIVVTGAAPARRECSSLLALSLVVARPSSLPGAGTVPVRIKRGSERCLSRRIGRALRKAGCPASQCSQAAAALCTATSATSCATLLSMFILGSLLELGNRRSAGGMRQRGQVDQRVSAFCL